MAKKYPPIILPSFSSIQYRIHKLAVDSNAFPGLLNPIKSITQTQGTIRIYASVVLKHWVMEKGKQNLAE